MMLDTMQACAGIRRLGGASVIVRLCDPCLIEKLALCVLWIEFFSRLFFFLVFFYLSARLGFLFFVNIAFLCWQSITRDLFGKLRLGLAAAVSWCIISIVTL